MQKTAEKLHNKVHLSHKYLLHILQEYRDEHATVVNAYENVDSAYALRESIAYLEDLVKELKKDFRKCEAKVGYQALLGEIPIKLGTWYCSGTVKFKQIPDIPKGSTQPVEYAQFMDFFGVKPEYAELDLFRLQWNNFMEFYNARIAAGESAVPGIDVGKSNQTYELAIRKKKAIEFK